MLGAIAGDMIGSVYERHPIKTMEFPLFQADSRFTDDTVLTVAVAYAILEQRDYRTALRDFGRRYPNVGYGRGFKGWLEDPDGLPGSSWGNGSAMRVSPVGFAFDDEEAVLAEARRSAEVSHNHPEGIKGAQATALAVFLARKGGSKVTIKNRIAARFGYNFSPTVAEIRPTYTFDVSCQGSVPQAIIAFLDSANYEDAVRLAVSLGGDSDTQACIAGAIAQAYYRQIPQAIVTEVRTRLTADLLEIVDRFNATFKL